MPAPNPSDIIDVWRTHFVPNYAPTTAWGNVASMFLNLPGLRSYYPMGVNTYDASNYFITDLANGFNLTTAPASTSPQINASALTTWMDFDGTEDYAFYADNAHFDISGTEKNIATALQGLTVGAWIKIDTLNSSLDGIISKWNTTSDQRSYALYLSGNLLIFSISKDGTNGTIDVQASTVVLTTVPWYFVVGRFDPGATIRLSVNGVDESSVAAQSAVFNSTAQFRIASINAGDYFDGRIAHAFVCSALIPNVTVKALYQHSRVLFGL